MPGLSLSVSDWKPLPAWVSHTGHYFVLSDTHGRWEELVSLLIMQPKGSKLVHLGDIGDRGPDSLACFDELANHPDALLIRGNHDLFIIDAFGLGYPLQKPYPEAVKWIWHRNGGAGFIQQIDNPPVLARVMEVLNRQVLYHIDGNLFFSHSGLLPFMDAKYYMAKPHRTEAEYDEYVPHLTSISSDTFFSTDGNVEKWEGLDFRPFIIHGHYRCNDLPPTEELNDRNRQYWWPRVDGWRIGVDWAGGMCALEILEHQYRYYEVV